MKITILFQNSISQALSFDRQLLQNGVSGLSENSIGKLTIRVIPYFVINTVGINRYVKYNFCIFVYGKTRL
jgi:hypothetical protein